MYCPNCSQQQISDEMRFCSRCGFSLGLVKELMTSGGTRVETEAPAQAVQRSSIPCEIRRGAWIMLASLLVVPLIGLLASIDDDWAVLFLFPFLAFMIGFVLILYGVFFAEKRARRKQLAASQVSATSEQPSLASMRHPELYPARSTPVGFSATTHVDTAKIAQPPSVTENTTRLLDDERDSHPV